MLVTAYENKVNKDGWIGLTDENEENVWVWVDGSPTNSYFNWQKDKIPSLDTRRNVGRVRLHQFGGGWQNARASLKEKVLICTRPDPQEICSDFPNYLRKGLSSAMEKVKDLEDALFSPSLPCA